MTESDLWKLSLTHLEAAQKLPVEPELKRLRRLKVQPQIQQQLMLKPKELKTIKTSHFFRFRMEL